MELIPLLEKISNLHSQQPVRNMATELRIMVATHGTVWSENMNNTIQELKAKVQQCNFDKDGKCKESVDIKYKVPTKQQQDIGASAEAKLHSVDDKTLEDPDLEEAVSKEFDDAFQELFDPLLPVRGHALMALAKLLQARDKKAMEKKDTLLKIFKENLTHEDSYIYLSAIKVRWHSFF